MHPSVRPCIHCQTPAGNGEGGLEGGMLGGMATVTTALCRLAWLPDLRPGVRSKVRCCWAASPTFDTAFAFRCSRPGEAGTHAWGRHPVTPDTPTASLAGQQAFGKVKASSAQQFPSGQAPSSLQGAFARQALEILPSSHPRHGGWHAPQ